MGWDIKLVDDDGTAVEVGKHQFGSTVAVGGCTRADMTLTFNYSWFYYQFIDEDDGLRWLNGKTGAETIERLEKAVDELGADEWERGEGYWAPTPGNAGSALQTLLKWVNLHPDATWKIV